jgi:hypothetical protein
MTALDSKMGANSPFQTLAHLRRRNERRAADGITAFSGTMTFVLLSQNESSRDDAEAWAELIGEKLGIPAADVQQRYQQHLRDEDARAAAQDRAQ